MPRLSSGSCLPFPFVPISASPSFLRMPRRCRSGTDAPAGTPLMSSVLPLVLPATLPPASPASPSAWSSGRWSGRFDRRLRRPGSRPFGSGSSVGQDVCAPPSPPPLDGPSVVGDLALAGSFDCAPLVESSSLMSASSSSPSPSNLASTSASALSAGLQLAFLGGGFGFCRHAAVVSRNAIAGLGVDLLVLVVFGRPVVGAGALAELCARAGAVLAGVGLGGARAESCRSCPASAGLSPPARYRRRRGSKSLFFERPLPLA